jgi:chromate transporter
MESNELTRISIYRGTISVSSEPIHDYADKPEEAETPAAAAKPVGFLKIAVTFFRIGATTFGGMWAATQKLEKELVRRKGWLTLEDQQTLMVASTLIPAPKFIAFGGLVGFRLRGWLGSVVSVSSLIAPGAIFVLTGAVLLNPDVLGAPLVPVRRAVGIAVVGLLFGNAYHQLKSAKVKGRKRVIGILLALSVAAAAIAGVPLLVAAVAGFAFGALLIRKD